VYPHAINSNYRANLMQMQPQRRLIATGKLGPWAEPSPQVWEIEICGHLYVTTVADSGSEVSVEVA